MRPRTSLRRLSAACATFTRTEPCDFHPYNTSFCKYEQRCLCCAKERNMVKSAKKNDAKYERGVSTMTVAYIRTFSNSRCPTCGLCLVTLADAWNPSSLSMDRIDNSKHHDCDPDQTVASCLQCNLWKNTWSRDEFLLVIDHAASGFDLSSFERVNIPEHRRGGSIWGKNVLKLARSNCKQKTKSAVDFLLTYDEFKHKYEEVQRGRCFACGLLLGIDVSFDRTEPTGGYNDKNITLMHYNCNAGKCSWPLSVLHATAVRSVAYRAGLAASTKKAND